MRIEIMATNEIFLGKEEHPGLPPNMKFIYLLDQWNNILLIFRNLPAHKTNSDVQIIIA